MHFTYEAPDKSQLFQGDLLKRTSEIDALLEIIHPTYSQKADYKLFVTVQPQLK